MKVILDKLIRALPFSLRLFLAARLKAEFAVLYGWSRRDALANLYLIGEGIEIGALDYPIRVANGSRISYVDREPLEVLKRTYPQLSFIQPPDIVDDGERLSTISDASQDFVVANGFLEHCRDPIGAIKNFMRVLKPGGVLFMAVPDKRMTFDVDRPVTPFAHLMQEHLEDSAETRREHFREAMRYIVGITDPDEIERHVERDMREVGHTHYHVWRQEDQLVLLSSLKTEAGLDVEVEAFVSDQARGEGILILRKGELAKDRRQAEASLKEARAAYAARYAGRDRELPERELQSYSRSRTL